MWVLKDYTIEFRPNGGTVIEGDDGTYIEVDESGVPLGEWRWDPDEGIWIFYPAVALGQLPQTGFNYLVLYIITVIAIAALLTGVALRVRKARRRDQ